MFLPALSCSGPGDDPGRHLYRAPFSAVRIGIDSFVHRRT
jgi:hypothetical protein